jgi:hypothetical protein
VHAADVKSVFRAYSIDVAAREKDDLKEEPIVVRLRKVVTPTCAIDVNELTLPSRPEAPVTMVCSTERLDLEFLVLPAYYYYCTSLGRITTQYHCHFLLKRTFPPDQVVHQHPFLLRDILQVFNPLFVETHA